MKKMMKKEDKRDEPPLNLVVGFATGFISIETWKANGSCTRNDRTLPSSERAQKNIINMGNGLLGWAQNKTACRILQQTKHSTNT